MKPWIQGRVNMVMRCGWQLMHSSVNTSYIAAACVFLYLRSWAAEAPALAQRRIPWHTEGHVIAHCQTDLHNSLHHATERTRNESIKQAERELKGTRDMSTAPGITCAI